jgi:type II secretory pathway component PulF
MSGDITLSAVILSWVISLAVIGVYIIHWRYVYNIPRGRNREDDIIFFTRQLSGMLRMKLPLHESVENVLVEMRRSLRTRFSETTTSLGWVADEVRKGMSLSESLALQKPAFPKFYVELVRVGERAERLSEVLSEVADFMERNRKLARDLVLLFIYPALVLFILLPIITFLAAYILPTFASLFEGMDQTLPWLTRQFNVLGRFLRAFPLGGVLFLGMLLYFWLRKKSIFNFLDYVNLHFPGFGPAHRHKEYAAFAGIMGVLLRGRVPLGEALELCASCADNVIFRKSLERMAKDPAPTLAQRLEKEALFPASFRWLVAMGEKNEILETALTKAADLYAAEAEVLIRKSLSWLEPSLIAAAGISTALFVFSVFLPLARMVSIITDSLLP